MTALRIVAAAALIGVAGLLVALVVIASGASATNARQSSAIAELRGQVRKAQARAAAAETKARTAGQGEVVALRGEVTSAKEEITALQGSTRSLSRRLSTLADCLPEVQTEMNSLSVDRYGYVSTDSQVSRVCQKVVYPDSTGD
jgi:chromosome segregation ATPase